MCVCATCGAGGDEVCTSANVLAFVVAVLVQTSCLASSKVLAVLVHTYVSVSVLNVLALMVQKYKY